MTARLGERDMGRIARSGLLALSSQEGLELFDAAQGSGETLLIPVRLDGGALRAQARAGVVPALLRGLVRGSPRRVRDGAAESFSRRLAGVAEGERERVVLDLVRGEVARVLGHASAEAIGPRSTFKEVGLDSLSAVELRNRLNAATGLRLPAAVVFDHPTPIALAAHLAQLLGGLGADAATGAVAMDEELNRLELMLAAAAEDGAQRTKIAARLHAFLARLDDSGQSGNGVAVIEKMQSATADEVFDFIDRELGS
jgi:acyl carrier protein